MAEDPQVDLDDYKELFDDLGCPEGMVKLRRATRSSAQVKGSIITPDLSLGNVIIDDPEDRRSFSITIWDRKVFRVWGGALDPSALTCTATHEAAFKQALLPGGGILYNDVLHQIELDSGGYFRGFSVQDAVMQWYIIASAPKVNQ